MLVISQIRRALALVATALLCIAALGATSASADGPATRVAGGYYPPADYAPWLTYISSKAGGYCTASLVAPDRVLTAAHCVDDDMSPGNWTARVGVRNRANPQEGQSIAVRGIVMHPSYDNPTTGPNADVNNYDLAVMFLAAPSTVAPGPIGTATTWGDFGTALGWGHYNLDHNKPLNDPNVKAVNLSLGSDAICHEWINTEAPQVYFPAIHLCAYDAEGDDCITHGDSGGPLVLGGYIIGITNSTPGRKNWGACGSSSMALFSWIASSELRDWPLTVAPPPPPPPPPPPNTACEAAVASLNAAKRKLKGAKRALRRAVFAPERRKARRKVKKARRRVAAARRSSAAVC
jgi:trypsin